ncbi:uncharacterized protein LOC106155512 [Lingula anatina]|uniref:Uncharacterized protein LOC106155512 n=1 Tax=Lingula anatina TaxID=7574 RepID=A0A1S3HIA9_LINAN|nr:uncharacterized protein LOC106155512 [Lingula anatina]|eukprot:XP_013385850.1 uncharacterized protein LOC106155512 [Lingula anatina]
MKQSFIGIFLALTIVFGLVWDVTAELEDADFSTEVEKTEKVEEVHVSKRPFTGAVLRGALRALRSRPARAVLRKLAEYYGRRSSVYEIVEVIEEVAKIIGRYDRAFSSHFIDAAVRLGFSRDFGLAVYNLVYWLI